MKKTYLFPIVEEVHCLGLCAICDGSGVPGEKPSETPDGPGAPRRL